MNKSPMVEAVAILVKLLAGILVLSLILMAFAFLLSVFYFHWSPNTTFIFEAGFQFFGGLAAIFRGVKKMQQAQAEQKHIIWYKQPTILTGIALLVSVPGYIIFSLSSRASMNSLTPSSVSSSASLAIALLFLTAAAYFWLQEKRRRKAIGGT